MEILGFGHRLIEYSAFVGCLGGGLKLKLGHVWQKVGDTKRVV